MRLGGVMRIMATRAGNGFILHLNGRLAGNKIGESFGGVTARTASFSFLHGYCVAGVVPLRSTNVVRLAIMALGTVGCSKGGGDLGRIAKVACVFTARSMAVFALNVGQIL